MMRTLAGRIRRRLSRFRTRITTAPSKTEKQATRRLRENPRSLVLWLDLIALSAPGMPEALRDQIKSHDLTRTGVILGFKDELESRMQADLESAYRRLEGDSAASVCADVAAEMVRLKTIAQCRDAHAEGDYYRDAEPYMQKQWDGVIWPIIQNLDFKHVLELAPGHGRNTEFLRRLASSVTLVDVNPNCIEACRARFGDCFDGCQFRYFVTTGDSLAMIDSESQTLVYSFDSMVHFDSIVVKAYVHEIARVLRPGGSAFLHHSNYGTVAPNSDWAHNPGNRSDMTAERMRAFASEAGLEVTFQRLSGLADGWGLEDLDALACCSVPSAPEMAAPSIRANAIEGVLEITRIPFTDQRGHFLNLFRRGDWSEIWGDRPIEQVNLSHNARQGTIRGLHLQQGHPPEVRLVTCVKGRVWDVAVDLRAESATRGQWHGIELSAEAGNSLLIPTGCAHGFQVLEPDSTLLYLHAAPYRPSDESGVRWDDPRLGVSWPLEASDLSERDRQLPLLEWVP